jgi:hypothetical protein
MNTAIATPTEDYKKDAQGRLVPLSMIRPIDMARDSLVLEIVAKANALAEQISAAKTSFFADIAAFVSMSAEEYDVKIGGEKGNVSLVSYDGRYKVIRAIQETLVFDERLQAAKALIDACLQRWSQGAKPEIKVLINDAFQVDKSGNINTGRVLGLRRLPIQDEEWQSAMTAIGDALQVAGSKSYVRIYERIGESGKYRPITLDMAGD